MGGAGAAGGARRGARTVRLSIELGASNEDRYPELSYRDLVADTERKKKDVQNGKKLEAFSDNDDDVARMAKQFEQKYGSMSTYGQRGRSKKDEFADIGAGYDENDSFIDNTDGYDEMIPPECDTYHGGFYINCGSLEFKSVPENQLAHSDNEAVGGQRTNKRRISSSTSEDSSSESSSESDAGERQIDKAKDGEVNGAVDSHKTDRRKMKDKNEGKKKTKKRRLESGATSGKQTSDEARLDGESADSRTSHSDSLTSKPAPSSENVATSDSSREVSDAKPELKLPPLVGVVLEELTLCVSRLKQNNPGITPKELEPHTDPYVLRLEQALATCDADVRCRRAAWVAAAKVLNAPRTRLLHRARALAAQPTPLSASLIPPSASSTTPQERESKSKKNAPAERVQKMETESSREKELTPEEKEKQISEILECLRTIIEQMKPEMIQTYKMECERIQEENKKIALANAAAAAASEQAPRLSERRLPKRRFPWCSRVRSLLAKLVKLCGGGGSATGQGAGDEAAARLLAHRVLPMFPPGFVRLPTLLRQANLNKDLKVSEIKKQKIPPPAQLSTSEPKLPSSSSVTITSSPIPKLPERSHSEGACGTADDPKLNGKPHKTKSDTGASSHKSTYNSIFSSFTLSSNTDVYLEKHKTDKEEHTTKAAVTVEKVTEPNKICLEKPTKSSENDKYMPPNSIGSITITPVTSNQKFDPRYQASKLANNTVTISSGNKITTAEPSIRVRSPAEIIKAANAMSSKDEKHKSKPEPKLPNPLQIRPPDKHSNSPLVIDTSHPKKDIAKCHSPNFARQANGEEGKKIDNIPRPGLIPVHHSPTFVKPAEKRLTEQKKTKDCPVVIVSDLDPLQDVLHVDDSSSDVELVEEIAEKPPDPSKVKTKIKNPESAKTTQPVKPADTEHHIQKSSSLPPSQASNHNLSSSAKEFKREDLNSRGPKSDDGNPRREHEKSTEKRDDTSGKIREDYNKDSIREYSSDKVQRKEHFDKPRYDSESSERQKRDNTAHSVKSQRRDEHSSHSDKSHKREEYTSRSENHKRNEYANHQDRSQRKDEHGTRPDKRKDDYSEKRKNEHASLSDKIKDAYASHSDKRKDENSTPSEKRKDEYYSHSEKRKDEYPSHSDKRRDHQAQHSGPRKDDYEHSKSSPDRIKRQDSSPHKETGSHSESHNRDQQGLKMPAGSESGRAKLDMKMDVEDGDIDIDKVMRGLRDLQSSQEPHFNNDSFGSSVNG